VITPSTFPIFNAMSCRWYTLSRTGMVDPIQSPSLRGSVAIFFYATEMEPGIVDKSGPKMMRCGADDVICRPRSSLRPASSKYLQSHPPNFHSFFRPCVFQSSSTIRRLSDPCLLLLTVLPSSPSLRRPLLLPPSYNFDYLSVTLLSLAHFSHQPPSSTRTLTSFVCCPMDPIGLSAMAIPHFPP